MASYAASLSSSTFFPSLSLKTSFSSSSLSPKPPSVSCQHITSSSLSDPPPPPSSPAPSLPSPPLNSVLPLSSSSLSPSFISPQPIVGRRCVVNRTTVAAAAAALGMAAMERAEARAALSATCELATSSSGIEFCDSVVGSGVEAEKGMLIKAHYTGKLLDGTVFDSSYNRGRPLVFRIGVGEVIRGWDQGILGTTDIPAMLAGGKRTLKIPAELAYGSRGAGCRGASCVIPPNSTLIFDVEFVGKA